MKDDEGTWIDDQAKLSKMATNFYKQLYTKDNMTKGYFIYIFLFSQADPNILCNTSAGVKEEKVYKALFLMKVSKVLGIDRYLAFFFPEKLGSY